MQTSLIKTEAVPRIRSIDQCRGFIIALMILSNYGGHLSYLPWILTHHRYGLSLAEWGATLFIFLVGMGYRISFQRSASRQGITRARLRAARRYCLIMLIGFPAHIDSYGWGALTHIGMAGLLALPFIDKTPRYRLVAALVYMALFQYFFAATEYGPWLMARRMNGGPLGALSWAFAMLAGTLAADLIGKHPPAKVFSFMMASGLVLCLAGFSLTFPWPGIKEAWPFTRYGMSAPILLYTTGIAFFFYLLFFLLNDTCGLLFPHLSDLGENPLLILVVLTALSLFFRGIQFFTGEPPLPLALIIAAVIYTGCLLTARYLHRNNIHFRL